MELAAIFSWQAPRLALERGLLPCAWLGSMAALTTPVCRTVEIPSLLLSSPALPAPQLTMTGLGGLYIRFSFTGCTHVRSLELLLHAQSRSSVVRFRRGVVWQGRKWEAKRSGIQPAPGICCTADCCWPLQLSDGKPQDVHTWSGDTCLCLVEYVPPMFTDHSRR